MIIDDETIEDIVKDTLTVDVATIQARIRNKCGIVNISKCDHRSNWNISRQMCMRCGVTALELYELSQM